MACCLVVLCQCGAKRPLPFRVCQEVVLLCFGWCMVVGGRKRSCWMIWTTDPIWWSFLDCLFCLYISLWMSNILCLHCGIIDSYHCLLLSHHRVLFRWYYPVWQWPGSKSPYWRSNSLQSFDSWRLWYKRAVAWTAEFSTIWCCHIGFISPWFLQAG